MTDLEEEMIKDGHRKISDGMYYKAEMIESTPQPTKKIEKLPMKNTRELTRDIFDQIILIKDKINEIVEVLNDRD